MAKTVFDVLEEKVGEHLTRQKNALNGGTATDFANYREMCGVIRGLNLALMEIADLSRNYEDIEDD